MIKKYILKPKKWLYAIIIFFPLLVLSQEGTKQVSPSTSLLSGLFYAPDLNYGSYFNSPAENSIHFEIADFNTEKFYFGFNWTEYAATAGTTTALNYATNGSFFYYRILDSNGTVMTGPTLLQKSGTNAAGQILTFAAAQNGPRRGALNPSGYLPVIYTPLKNDTFTIEYWRGTSATNSAPLTTFAVSPFFDFTVATASQVKLGRVFATKWGLVTTVANGSAQYSTDINTAGSPSFFVYTDLGNVLKLSYPDIRPLAYIIGANSYGVNDSGNFPVDRQSINNPGGVPPTLAGGYDIFLNQPDESVFPSSAVVAAGPPTFGTSIITPKGSCNVPPYYINFVVQEVGDYRIIIKGVGYTDRVLFAYGLSPGDNKIEWDGKDGSGTNIPNTTLLTFEITAFADRFNLPIFDAERNAGGIAVQTIRPTGVAVQSSNLFWDDSLLIPFAQGTNNGNNLGPIAAPNSTTIGTVSPAHTWNSASADQWQNYGNVRTINTWGYLYYQTATGTSNLLCADTTITKIVNNATPTIGNNVVFTLTASNTVSGSTANNVVVNDVLPNGYTLVSAVPSSGTWTNPNWNIGNLVNGTPRTLTITATVNAGTNYTNIANISTVNFETNYNNNASAVKVTPAAMPEFTATNICPVNNIDVIPPKGVELNSLHIGTVPAGSTLVWYTNAAHTGAQVTNTFITISGSYYAFYYDAVGNCYSPASAKTNILIQDCKCRKSPATGTPDGYTKIGITTKETKLPVWPENVANGFIAMESTNKGFVITRTTTSSILQPRAGMLIYDTANNCFSLYNGTTWHCIAQTCNE